MNVVVAVTLMTLAALASVGCKDEDYAKVRCRISACDGRRL